MSDPILIALLMAWCAFMYRMRGGAFVHTSEQLLRLLWSIAFATSVWLLDRHHQVRDFWVFVPAQFLAIVCIGHGFCQNSGHFPRPSSLEPRQNRWPQLWDKELTQAEWDAMSLEARAWFDFKGMASVGAVRGAIVFIPAGIWLGWSVAAVGGALVATSFLQAASYWLGWRTPWSVPGAAGYGAGWAEFYIGASWVLAGWIGLAIGGG